jgi:hypothetical protein
VAVSVNAEIAGLANFKGWSLDTVNFARNMGLAILLELVAGLGLYALRSATPTKARQSAAGGVSEVLAARPALDRQNACTAHLKASAPPLSSSSPSPTRTVRKIEAEP